MRLIRRITQWFGFIVSHAYFQVFFTKLIYSGPLKATCVPFLTCHACPMAVFSCPVGTMQHYMIIRQIPFVLLGHLGLVLIAVGRMVCGWVCPIGLLQDLAYKLNTVKINIPKFWHYFRYFSFFALVVIIPYISAQPWFCILCPVGTLEAGLPWVLWNPMNPEFLQPTVDVLRLGWFFILKVVVFLAILFLVIVYKRAFCKIFCPLSVIFAPFNKISIVRMSVSDRSSCHNCGRCKKVCPMGISISDDPNSGECIRCLECAKCDKVKIGIGDLNEDI